MRKMFMERERQTAEDLNKLESLHNDRCSALEKSLRRPMNSSDLDFIFRFGIVSVFFVKGVSKLQKYECWNFQDVMSENSIR